MANDGAIPLFCARCAIELIPGEGNLYVIKIEAVADPGPIVLAREHLAYDHRQVIDELIQRMQDLSEQGAGDDGSGVSKGDHLPVQPLLPPVDRESCGLGGSGSMNWPNHAHHRCSSTTRRFVPNAWNES